jgi:hypothetical protein
MAKKQTIKDKEERITELEAQMNRGKTFKLVKRLIFIAVTIAIAIGISMHFPAVRGKAEAVLPAGMYNWIVGYTAPESSEWKENPTLSGISITKDGDFVTVTRENLDPEVVPLINSMREWSKTTGEKFLIFGGSLFRNSAGELIWRINGYDTSFGAVADKVKGDGLFIVDNPEGLRVPNTKTSVGTLALTKETVRFLGFLWKTGDRLVLRSANFLGQYEVNDPEDATYNFAYSSNQLARLESKLTPAICSIGLPLN